jgi:hypothetical protein
VPCSRRTIYWTCQLAGWFTAAGVNLLFVLLSRDERQPPLGKFVVTFAASAPIAIAWTHVLRGVMRRRRWLLLGLAGLLPRVIAASFVIGAAIAISAAPVWLVVFGGGLAEVSSGTAMGILGWSWGVLAWSVVYLGVHYFERWRQVELEKLQLAIVAKDAQLHGLMAQLQPHFLFNCLNSVRSLIAEDPSRARDTVTALSNLMRYSLTAGKASTVPLASEIAMVRTYFELESVRFDDRLATEIEIATDTDALHVPAMLVQLLVENGVKHGVERSPAGGTVRVASWRERGALRIRVTSPGRIGASEDSTKIGLANARERLRLLYGDGATLALRDGDRTVIADVSIPLSEAAA